MINDKVFYTTIPPVRDWWYRGVKIGVGGVIGFIPFGFGNDPQLAKVALAVSVIFAMFFLIAFLRGSGII